jgi:hypothetical protein
LSSNNYVFDKKNYSVESDNVAHLWIGEERVDSFESPFLTPCPKDDFYAGNIQYTTRL